MCDQLPNDLTPDKLKIICHTPVMNSKIIILTFFAVLASFAIASDCHEKNTSNILNHENIHQDHIQPNSALYIYLKRTFKRPGKSIPADINEHHDPVATEFLMIQDIRNAMKTLPSDSKMFADPYLDILYQEILNENGSVHIPLKLQALVRLKF